MSVTVAVVVVAVVVVVVWRVRRHLDAIDRITHRATPKGPSVNVPAELSDFEADL